MNTKKLMPLLLLLPMFFLFLSPALSQEKNQVKEERQVSAFSKIGISISADVIFTQEATKVVLEGSQKDIERITTEVKDGKLKISTKSGFSGNLDKVRIYISSPQLEEIGLSGSGNILAEGTVKTESFRIALSGSGDINFKNLQTSGKIDVALSGSGDITLAGNELVQKVSIAISGSGDINLGNLAGSSVDIAISGSGDCVVNATDKLDCAISGSGDVSYKGKPQVNAKVSGSGKINSL